MRRDARSGAVEVGDGRKGTPGFARVLSPGLAPFVAPFVAPVLALTGALAWLLPILSDLAQGPWRDAMHSHGPVIVLVAAVLAWQRWGGEAVAVATRCCAFGGTLVVIALALASLGRWGDAPALQAAALAPMLAGSALLSGGPSRLRALAFPVAFLLFAVPLPAALADMLTQPMKQGVSLAAAWLLAALGHAVSLDGVVLGIGPYRLLVADACAGLNSLLMLEAFGLLYLHLVRHPSPARTALLALAIVPISLAANVVRVVLLALVTVYFGDAAGQGLVHGASGVILFVAALAMMLPLDGLLRRLLPARALLPASTPVRQPQRLPPSWRPLAGLGVVLWAGAAIAAFGPLATPPQPLSPPLPSFATWMPDRFGGWQVLPARAAAQVAAATDGAQVYDDLYSRTYRHADGRQVMLTLAYAREQHRATRIHEPPVCYVAAGFRIQRVPRLVWSAGGAGLTLERMLTQRESRSEAVVWWVRLGHRQDTPQALAAAWTLFEQRLAGQVPDGMLVRASSLVAADAGAAEPATYAAPQAFLSELLAAVPPAQRQALALALP